MKKNIYKRTLCLIISAVVFLSLSPVSFAEDTSRIDAARSFADTVLKYGRYIEGSKYPELLVDGINTKTMESVEWKWQGETNYPSNLFNQQNFLRTLVGLSNLTGDTKYKEIAKKQMKLWFENFTDESGLIYTGAHTFIDAKSGEIVTTGYHEMKDNTPFYELMYEVDPEATIKYMEAFWNAHILDWSNLSMNRHGAYDKEMGALWDNEYTDTSINFNNGEAVAFQSTGNDLIAFAFFISEKTGNKRAEEWALRLLQKYIEVADDDTGLSGAQYGEMDGGDRAYLQFGEEFRDTAKEYNYVNRYKIKTIAGYAPKVLLPYYERTGNKEVLDYVVKTIEGVATYAYDATNHRLNTPMWSDGTTLCGYELKRNGYYGNEGDKLPEYESVTGPLLTSAIYAHRLSGSSIIWKFARDLAKGYGLGDIGTAPGEGVSLITNEKQKQKSAECINAMLDLYKATNNSDYLALAERMGENIINSEKKANMFLSSEEYFNAEIGNASALSLLRIEAAKQGKFDAVPTGNTEFGIDIYYDGMGRVSENSVIYHQKEEKAQTLTIENGNIIIPLQNEAGFTDISGHSAQKAIRAIASLGAIKDCADGKFLPDEYITRSDFITYCAQLCGIERAGLIDSNLENSGNITKEEAASVLVKALRLKNSETVYTACGALSQFSDSNNISQWAQEYCDIAASYYMVNNRGDEYFSPKANITRGDAAVMLKKLSDLTDTDKTCITYAIEPLDASKNIVTYTSSNRDVVEIDENGRIFPLKEGSAEITAMCDGAVDTCSVSVISAEDWMIKSIKVNGKGIENFSPMTQSYTKELFIGETQIPQISAQSYSGERVTVIMPKILPGVAKIYVEGMPDKAYFLSLIPEKTDYVLCEDFESYAEGTVPHSITKDKSVWWLNSSGWVNGSAPIKVKPHPVTGSNAAEIPYIGNLMQMSARFYDAPYAVGASADDGYIVLEYDLMCGAKLPGLSIRLGCKDDESGENKWAINQEYTDTTIIFNNDKTIGTYTPNTVHSVKLIIDKKTLKSDVRFNGEKVLSQQMPQVNVTEIDSFIINAYKGINSNTMLYLDNVKIYELPAETDAKSDFYNEQGDSITRIGDELQVSFEKDFTAEYTGEVRIIGAIYTPEGILRKTVCEDATITAGKTQTLESLIDVSAMQKGDFLCVYVWTKELCPIIVQKLIYKC